MKVGNVIPLYAMMLFNAVVIALSIGEEANMLQTVTDCLWRYNIPSTFDNTDGSTHVSL